MLNLLTIDIEDYFQVHAFSNVIKYEDWARFECRVERNTDRLLQILKDLPPTSNLSLQALNNVNSTNTGNPTNSSNPTNPSNSTNSSNPTISLTQKVKATFFVLGWIAERYPDLVRRIQKESHEIACHGYSHRLIYNQSRDEFRQDIKRAKALLEDITGDGVIGYRAPSYSITKQSQWALPILAEEGFKYDSSIFPIRHDFYGMPEAPRFPFLVSLNENSNFEFSVLDFGLGTTAQQYFSSSAPNNLLPDGSKLKTQNSQFSLPQSAIRDPQFIVEFPISTVKLFSQNIPISGGGYFRFFPYSIIRNGLRRINEMDRNPFVFYLHPWEIDPDQPRISGLSSRSKFRHYLNLDQTESKFRKLLEDFRFSAVRDFLERNCCAAE